MKKHITIAALLAAGTALANAAEETITFTSAGTVNNGGNYAGIVFTLSGTDTTRFTEDYDLNLPKTLSLDSISIDERSGYDWASETTLYITDSNYGFVGIANDTSKADDTWTFSFSGLTLSTQSTYYAYFWKTTDSTISSTTTTGTTIAAAKYYSVQAGAFGGSLTTGTASEWGLLNGQASIASSSYAPGMTIVTSIPEPSAFGLLAGLGALALVASRRRRRK